MISADPKITERFLKDSVLLLGHPTPLLRPISNDWFNDVETKHQCIRELLGGVNKSYQIIVNNSTTISQTNKAYDLVSALSSLIPKYFIKYDIKRDDLYHSKVPNTNIKWTKHISTYLDRYISLPEEKEKEVFRILSILGELWSEAEKLKESKEILHILTDPCAFLRLGHYNVDNGSCFRNRGPNDIHKVILAATENSFVGILSNLSEIDLSIKDNIALKTQTRFWGTVYPDEKLVLFNNIYPRLRLEVDSFKESILDIFKDILKTDDLEIRHNSHHISYIYNNFETRFMICPKNYAKTYVVKTLNENSVQKYGYCYNCWHNTRTEVPVKGDIDGLHYCAKCFSNLCPKVCEISGLNTRVNLRNAIYEDKPIVALEIVLLANGFKRCTRSNIFYKEEDLMEDEYGLAISKKFAAQQGLFICKFCNKIMVSHDHNCISTQITRELAAI